ncbi:MAG: fused MFS/spermidine synthase [Alphaproteobacteria bacterium]
MHKTQLLFIIILIEGYVVLATELLAIRQLIPFVGSGTETISIIISAVLLPLAIGYHAGGKAFSRQYQLRKAKGVEEPLTVRKLLLRNIVTALIILSIGMSYLLMDAFFGLLSAFGATHRLTQTTVYCLLFLVYPVYLLGQTVPLVSNYFSRHKLSEITGRMLFFSTAGSFLGSVFSTIVLMTTIGVHNTVILTLGLLCVLVILLVRRPLAYENFLCGFIFLMLLLMNGNTMMDTMRVVSNNAYNIVQVIDEPHKKSTNLIINRSHSSKISNDPKQNFVYWQYVQSVFIDTMPQSGPPKDILILGAGGFTIGLTDKHNNYLYVDIDKALKEVVEKNFLRKPLTPNKRFLDASARAFVHTHDQQYDLILIDTYTNFLSIAQEATTKEFLQDTKKLLKPNGVLLANVIMSPDFRELFSVRYHNTFASVFPVFSRQVLGNYKPWPNKETSVLDMNNVIYSYYNHDMTQDSALYTDDRNTYSLDRD